MNTSFYKSLNRLLDKSIDLKVYHLILFTITFSIFRLTDSLISNKIYTSKTPCIYLQNLIFSDIYIYRSIEQM